MIDKAWQQDYEATGYIESTVRKQRDMNATAQLTFFFLFSPELQPVVMVLPEAKVGLSTSVTLTGMLRSMYLLWDSRFPQPGSINH